MTRTKELEALRDAIARTKKDLLGRHRRCPFCGVEIAHYKPQGGQPLKTCGSRDCRAKWRKFRRSNHAGIIEQARNPVVELRELVRAIREGVVGIDLHRAAEKAARAIEEPS